MRWDKHAQLPFDLRFCVRKKSLLSGGEGGDSKSSLTASAPVLLMSHHRHDIGKWRGW